MGRWKLRESKKRLLWIKDIFNQKRKIYKTQQQMDEYEHEIRRKSKHKHKERHNDNDDERKRKKKKKRKKKRKRKEDDGCTTGKCCKCLFKKASIFLIIALIAGLVGAYFYFIGGEEDNFYAFGCWAGAILSFVFAACFWLKS